jgi:peptidoglycan/LPS O-acetylase OafA/YrhL
VGASRKEGRDKILDGYRGVAVLGVVLGHAIAYRFGAQLGGMSEFQPLLRLAQPLSDLGVKLFFVISGYIITALLLREEAAAGRVNIRAFYSRRMFRILPPFFAYLVTLWLARWSGWIDIANSQLIASASFTCNLDIVECVWWTAHTWTLAVEEQYYLLWPPLLTMLPTRLRSVFLTLVTGALLATFVMMPFEFHSNYSAFPCIAVGAFYATSTRAQQWVARHSHGGVWLLVTAAIVIGYSSAAIKLADLFAPIAIIYIIFSAYRIAWLRSLLEGRLLQVAGSVSYSLYLWQQLFLARPDTYNGAPPLWALPIVVAAAVILIERPSIKLGKRVSVALSRPILTTA